jgi:subfamily B ATP-binding cassette protein MsbA
MSNIQILKRLYKDYTKNFLNKIFLAVFFSILVAISTSATAWLLDPAIEKIFLNKDQTLIFVIPILIIIAFSTKGISLYIAKTLMIKVAEEVKKKLQINMLSSFINADTEYIENRHSGKYISNINFDVNQITGMLSTSFLNFFKDGLTLVGLLVVMFIQNWILSLIALIMIPLASITAKRLGKRMAKVATEAQERSGDLNKYLIDLFKNHKIIKIFQRENFEYERSEKFVNELKEKSIKIATILIRATPIMEVLT